MTFRYCPSLFETGRISGTTRYGLLNGVTGEFCVNASEDGDAFTAGPEVANPGYRIVGKDGKHIVEYPVTRTVSGAGSITASADWASFGETVTLFHQYRQGVFGTQRQYRRP